MSMKRKLATQGDNQVFVVFTYSVLVLSFIAMGFLGGLPSAQAQAVNKMLSPDGKDDYVSIPVCPERDPLTLSSFTVMGWIKFSDPLTSKRDAATSAWRLGGPTPPDTGQTMTPDFSGVLTIDIKKDGTNFWGLEICDSADCEGVVSPINDLIPGWHHLAATYDHSTGRIVLYRDGMEVSSGTVPLGTPLPICHITLFRHVASLNAEGADEFALLEGVLSADDIAGTYDCGLNSVMAKYASDPSINLTAYYPFDEFGGPNDQVILDKSGNPAPYDGFRGSDTSVQRSDPTINESDLTVALEDSDRDGFPDACDNCPGIPNDQADQDGDGAGDLCDSCSYPDPNGDPGGECSWTEEGIADEVMGLAPTLTFRWGTDEYPAPDAFMVSQDCNNTRLICFDLEGKPLPSKCQRPSSYVLTVGEFCYDESGQIKSSCEENEDPVSGVPGGDLQRYTDKMATTITCDLLDTYDFSAFANGANCYAVHISSTHDRDRNWADGFCSQPPCVEPDQHFPSGYEWIGRATSGTFKIDPTIIVPINIKVTSFPNSINLNGGGEITLGIYSTADFDATKIKPDTVVLKKSRLDPINSYCAELNKTETRDLTETLCGDPGDIGACNNADGVARDDMILHLDVPCLPFTEADIGEWEAVVTGKAEDAVGNTINFFGTDKLIVR